MAFRRRYTKNKKFNRNRKKIGRFMKHRYGRTRIPRAMGFPQQKVWYFKRHFETTSLLAAADGQDSIQTYQFTLDLLPAYADFQNLFDWYKINYITLNIMPYFSEATNTGTLVAFSTTSSVSNLRIFTAVDYNDNSTPASINAIREYQNCKVTRYIFGQKRKFRPRPLIETNTSNPDVQYPIGNPWVSTDTSGVQCPHFGLKLGVDTSVYNTASIAQNDVLLKIEGVMYIACKAPR